jgi:hypothetical protein
VLTCRQSGSHRVRPQQMSLAALRCRRPARLPAHLPAWLLIPPTQDGLPGVARVCHAARISKYVCQLGDAGQQATKDLQVGIVHYQRALQYRGSTGAGAGDTGRGEQV